MNADGVVSSEPASIAFTIVPPVWQRWWFISLIVIALVAVTHLIYRYHTRRLIELERVRTRIATDLHDDIGASLSKIAILSDVAGQELSAMKDSPVAGPLAQIADTSRDCVDAMSDIVWAVNPQRDHLSDRLIACGALLKTCSTLKTSTLDSFIPRRQRCSSWSGFAT